MHSDPLEVPPEVDALIDELTSRGFEVVSNRRGGMGGVEILLREPHSDRDPGSGAEIMITSDRDRWTVALRFAGMTRFIDPRVWAALLDGTAIGAPDVDSQARFVRDRLADAAQAASVDPAIEGELVRLGEAHMRQQILRPR